MGKKPSIKSILNEALVSGVIEVAIAFRPAYRVRGKNWSGSVALVIDITNVISGRYTRGKSIKSYHSAMYPNRFAVLFPFLIKNLHKELILPRKLKPYSKEMILILETNDPILYSILNPVMAIPDIRNMPGAEYMDQAIKTIERFKRNFQITIVRSHRGWGEYVNAVLKKGIKSIPAETFISIAKVKSEGER